MAHITEVTVTGLCGRDTPFHLKLDRHINVIFGLNGSGKTSLLKILHSAMWNDPTMIENVAFESATVHVYSLDYKAVFEYHIKKKDSNKDAGISEIDFESPNLRISRMHAIPETRPTLTWKRIGAPHKGEDKKKGGRWRHAYLPTSRITEIVSRAELVLGVGGEYEQDEYLAVC